MRWRAQNGGRLRILIALIMVVGASALFWTSRDYTVVAPDWDGQVRGIAYNPSHLFRASDQLHVTPEQIDRDLAQLSRVTGHIRTYTVDGGMDKVPEIARRYGMMVSLGIWISPDLAKNDQQIDLAIKTALANRRVIDRVIVGNETQLVGSVSADQLERLSRPGAGGLAGAHQGHHRRDLVDLGGDPRGRQACGRDLRPSAALLGECPYQQRDALPRQPLRHHAADISRQADRDRRGGLAVGRPHPRIGGSLASPTKPISCAPSSSMRRRRVMTIT